MDVTKKKYRIRSWKETLKRMLLAYSLSPVFVFMVLCVAVALCVGSFFTVKDNRETNRAVTNDVNNTVSSYEALVTELSSMEGVVDHNTSTTKRQKLVRRLYAVSVDVGHDAVLYVLDEHDRVCLCIGGGSDEVPTGSVVPLDPSHGRDWKILDVLKEESQGAVVFPVARGSSRRIAIGSAVRHDRQLLGYVVVMIPAEDFTGLLSGFPQSNVIVDKEGWAFASGNYSLIDEVGRLERTISGKTGFFTYEGGFYYATSSPAAKGTLRIDTITDDTDMVTVLTIVFATGFFLLLLMFALLCLNAERMAVKSTADLRTINHAFERVMEGDLNARLAICSTTELENIGNCYNEMLDSLKRQIAANKELAELVALAQGKRLESQFSYHFLFNTLDNIRFMCRIDQELAESMIVSLSQLLRYHTGNANETVTAAQDFKYIRIYLEIMKVRFMERFNYQILIAPEVESCLMPKLLLQPLLENAIKYGFIGREHLNVWVSAYREGGRLLLLCRDDGSGMSEALLKNLNKSLDCQENKSSHLGLYNVHRRLKLKYGQEYGIVLKNKEGMEIVVCLPFEKETEQGGETREEAEC